jgi:hypothetical protein
MPSLYIFFFIMAFYLLLSYLMYKEFLPSIWGLLLVAFFIMGIVALTRPGTVSQSDFYRFLGEGAARVAPTMMTFILAGVFARAQIETGIVENIVKRAAELGGDRPFVVVLILGFASAYTTIGAFAGGAFVCHLIALPILLSMGLSPITAAVVQGFGCGQAVLFWAPHWNYLASLTKVTMQQAMPFILIYQPIITAAWIGFVIYQFKVNRLPLRWAVAKEGLTKVEKKVPLYSLLCPLLPLLFIIGFKMPDHFAFLASAVIAIIVTQPKSGRKLKDMGGLLSRVYVNGISDVSYLIALLIGIGFILRATDFPFVKTILGESLRGILPVSAIGFIPFFAIFIAIFGLFRGPAMPWALGGAIYGSIASVGIYPQIVPGALIATANIFTVVADVTTGYTVYICSLAKVSIIDFLKKVYVTCVIYMVIGLVIITLYYRMW